MEFRNDGFGTLTAAYQMTFGEWPARDFMEDGRILQILVWLVVLLTFGHGLLGEVWLSSGALAISSG